MLALIADGAAEILVVDLTVARQMGRRRGDRLLLAAGFALVAVSDAIYLVQAADDT